VGNKMKFIVIIGLVAIIPGLVNGALATKVVPLPDLLNPELIRVDENQIYISEGANIYIYSLKDFRLLKKFGKRGEGPQEFLTISGVLGTMWLEIQPDDLFIHSMYKISYFSKKGTFIKEKKINMAHAAVLKPIENRVVGVGFPSEKGIRYWTINIYNSNLEKIKEIYRYERAFYPDRDINLLDIKMPDFCVYDKKIFVADTEKTGTIYVFDLNGRQMYSIKPGYEKVEITPKVEKRLRENSIAGNRRNFYETYKHRIKFPEYFPAMRFMVAADEKLYIMTYKTTDDKTQFIIHTTPGKFLEKVFLPVKDMEVRHFCSFTIKNNKLYQLYDNEDTEIWELHITTIQVQE
jgi:hypothetical protein